MGSTDAHELPDSPAPAGPAGQADAPTGHRLYSVRILRRVFYPALLLVLAWGVGWMLLLHRAWPDVLAGEGTLGWMRKEQFEWAALGVLGLALGVVIRRCYTRRDAGLLWLTALVALFLGRELHFTGSSAAVYPGLAGLTVLALWRPRWTEGMLTTRRVATLLAMTVCCYAFAVSLDGHWWFDWDAQWTDAGKLAEEILELTGHGLILVVACIAPCSGPTGR